MEFAKFIKTDVIVFTAVTALSLMNIVYSLEKKKKIRAYVCHMIF